MDFSHSNKKFHTVCHDKYTLIMAEPILEDILKEYGVTFNDHLLRGKVCNSVVHIRLILVLLTYL